MKVKRYFQKFLCYFTDIALFYAAQWKLIFMVFHNFILSGSPPLIVYKYRNGNTKKPKNCQEYGNQSHRENRQNTRKRQIVADQNISSIANNFTAIYGIWQIFEKELSHTLNKLFRVTYLHVWVKMARDHWYLCLYKK